MTRYQIITILIMAIFTYLPRVIPITFYRKTITSTYIKSVLYYLPYAVLGALTFPGIINSTPIFIESLVGGLTCIFFSYKEKGLVFVAIAGIVACYVTNIILTLI